MAINVLDQNTINKIAAGEVIERPASVVKELVENSIDSGANAVTVEIKEGGLKLIRITDNGSGIEKDDIKKAFLRHATSKIKSVEDLVTIGSLGFRGEALSSVSAVAQVELITKIKSSMTGIRYEINGGKEISYEEIGCPDGTTFLVRNLFYNTPARRKFMKTASTEGNYVSELIERLALSRPDISFKFINNGQNKLYTSGNKNQKDIIYSVFGRDITSNLIPINCKCENISIEGYLGKPYISRGNRTYENYFVNDRYVKSSIITKAIEDAYKTFVMVHKFPFTAIHFKIRSDYLDVNVHPTKMELRYKNPEELYNFIYSSVRDSLTNKELIPQVAIDNNKTEEANFIPKESIPEPFEIQRKKTDYILQNEANNISKSVARESNNSIFYNSKEKIKETQNKSIENKSIETQSVNIENKPIEIQGANIENMPIETQSTNIKSKPIETQSENKESKPIEIQGANVENKPIETQSTNIENKPNETQKSFSKYFNTENKDNDANLMFVSDATVPYKNISSTQLDFFEEKFLSSEGKKKHRLIGQLFKTYWLIEYNNSLFIMDQHAAHEKIMYEELTNKLKNKCIYSQMISPPMVFSLNGKEEAALCRNLKTFVDLGFQIENFGGKEYALRALPDNLFGLSGRDVFIEFIDGLTEEVNVVNQDIFIRKLSSMACKAAIKGNQSISYKEADNLIEQLLSLENPYTCPHGRPTLISMTEEDIEKKFRRIQN